MMRTKRRGRVWIAAVCAVLLLALTAGFSYAYSWEQSNSVRNEFVSGVTYELSYEPNAPAGVTVTAPAVQRYVGTDEEDTHRFEVSCESYATVEGWTLLGWTTERGGTTAELQPGDTLTLTRVGGALKVRQTLYGVWYQWKPITLSYNANGGENAPAAVTQQAKTPAEAAAGFDFTVSPLSEGPTRTGYKFLGWAKTASATVATYTGGESIPLTEDLELFAVWKQLYGYTLSFDANLTAAQLAVLDEYGVSAAMPESVTEYDEATRHEISTGGRQPTVTAFDGIRFLGWDEDPDAATPSYPASETRSVSIAAGSGMDTTQTLYAIWEWRCYVRFHANDTDAAKVGGDASTETILTSATSLSPNLSALYSNNDEQASFQKDGWYVTGFTAADGSRVTMPLTKLGREDPTDVYCTWEQGSHAVIYDANGGSFGGSDQIVKPYVDPGAKTVISDVPSWGEYRFLGWAKSADRGASPICAYEGKDYDGHATLSATVDVSVDEPVVRLYAVWARAYTLHYDLAGGTWSEPNDVVRYGRVDSYAFPITDVKPDFGDGSRFEFAYWQRNSGGRTVSYGAGATVTLRGDQPEATLTARYREKVVRRVIYYANAPADISSYSYSWQNYTITSQEETTLYTIPSDYGGGNGNIGSTLGWATSKERADLRIVDYVAGDTIVIRKSDTRDITLYAIWPEYVRIAIAVCYDPSEDMGPFTLPANYRFSYTDENGDVFYYSSYRLLGKAFFEETGRQFGASADLPTSNYAFGQNRWPQYHGRAVTGVSSKADRSVKDLGSFTTRCGSAEKLVSSSNDNSSFSLYSTFLADDFVYDSVNDVYLFRAYAVYEDYIKVRFVIHEEEDVSAKEALYLKRFDEQGKLSFAKQTATGGYELDTGYALSVHTDKLKPDDHYEVDGWCLSPWTAGSGGPDGFFPTNPVYSVQPGTKSVAFQADSDLFAISASDAHTVISAGESEQHAGTEVYTLDYYIHYNEIEDPNLFAVLYDFGLTSEEWHLALGGWSPRYTRETSYTFSDSFTVDSTYDPAWLKLCPGGINDYRGAYYFVGFATSPAEGVKPSIWRSRYTFPAESYGSYIMHYPQSMTLTVDSAGKTKEAIELDGEIAYAYCARYYAVYGKAFIISEGRLPGGNLVPGVFSMPSSLAIYTHAGLENDTWEVTIPNAEPNSAYGYKFLGWSTVSGASVPTLFAGDTITVSGREARIYAVWQTGEYIYDLQYYDGDRYLTHTQKTWDVGWTGKAWGQDLDVTIDENLHPTKDGYTFLGWADSPDATEPQYSYDPVDGFVTQSTVSITAMYRGDTTVKKVYAVWFENESITLNCDANDGAFADLSTVKQQTQSITRPGMTELAFTIPTEEPTREGYTFLGWADDPNAADPQYAPGEELTLSADKTVYAVWKLNEAPGGSGGDPGNPGNDPGNDPGGTGGDPGNDPGNPGTDPGNPGTDPGNPGNDPGNDPGGSGGEP